MDEKKTAISTVEELNEDGSKSLPQDRPNGQTQQNLFEPRHLTEDQFWETLYDALDYGIVAITIALLVKTSLCIYAYYHDAPNRGLTLDAASLLSRGLIYLNGQVSQHLFKGTFVLKSPACDGIHYHLWCHPVDSSKTLCSLSSAKRCEYCGPRAIAS